MSHMINGRTYRNIITTNDQKPVAPVEPQKLNVITTAIIPNVVPQPEPVGDGFSKMITTASPDPVKIPEAIPIPPEPVPLKAKRKGKPKK